MNTISGWELNTRKLGHLRLRLLYDLVLLLYIDIFVRFLVNERADRFASLRRLLGLLLMFMLKSTIHDTDCGKRQDFPAWRLVFVLRVLGFASMLLI